MSNFKYKLFSRNILKAAVNYCNGYRSFYKSNSLILGIETSCDDTGCAVVTNSGNILGESLHSQQVIHLNNGGIIPPLAQSLHRQHIERIVQEAVEISNVTFNDIDAIAATVKPGLPLSLAIGMKYGKYLCRMYNKPFIPIHHMEAHALTARMIDSKVEFPFLVLLISGGHCLLAVVKAVDEFLLFGKSLDDAPGEAFDKTARRLKLKNIPEFSSLSGGQAIELAATKAENPLEFVLPLPLSRYRDCNFSFAGLKNKALKYILKQEEKYGVEADGIIPGVHNLCAGFQLAVARHLCHRTQRAMEFIKHKNLIPSNNLTLVLSGGAACNNFITKALQLVCDAMGYHLVRPPPKLCTDNGIMIAWNGVERWHTNKGVYRSGLDSIDIQAKCPLGIDISEEVSNEKIKCDWVKLTSLLKVKEEKIVTSL